MNKDSNTDEQRLLNHASLDELIKIKMEEEMKAEKERAKEKHLKKIVKNIAEVPKELIFSKKAVYRVFNRITKIETFLNGLQAEAMLGLQTSVRAKIKAGEIDAFSTDDTYIKFEKVEY